MLKLRNQRTFPQGVHHLIALSYSVGSGIVLTKDNALLAAFELQGHDLANMTPEERNLLTSRLSDVINQQFKAGWVIQFELIRKECPGYSALGNSAFPDPISKLIDAEKRLHAETEGAHYQSITVLTLRYKPPALQNPWFKHIFYSGMQEQVLPTLESDIAFFERQLESFQMALTGVVSLRRLKEYFQETDAKPLLRDELLNYLHFTLSCEHTPLNKPMDGYPAEGFLGLRDFFPGDILKIGEKYVVILSLSVAPTNTHPNMLNKLDALPLEYRWVTRFHCLDNHEALSITDRLKRYWQQQESNQAKKMFKLKAETDNLNAVQMRLDAQQVAADIHSGEIGFGYCTQNLVLFNENRTELLRQTKLVIQEMSRLGHNCFTETLNAVDAWLGTIPGNAYHNVRKQLTHTVHLSNMVPLTSVWMGYPYSPNPFMMQERSA